MTPLARVAPFPLTYFAYSGSLVAAVLVVTALVRARLGEHGWMFTWQLLTVAALTLAYAGSIAASRYTDRLGLSRRWPRATSTAAWLSSAAYVATAVALLWLDHRRFVIAIALLQATAVCALVSRLDHARRFGIVALSLAGWGLASGLTFTHLSDWLVDGDPSTGFAAFAFVLSFALVVAELSDDGAGPAPNVLATRLVAVAALGLFAAYALRTDHLLVDWVPLHRSYFADVAQFVRDGHWLLWDVPSLYGFGSILCLALIPAPNAWQALFELTAIFMVVQSAIVFTILRWGRTGWRNAAFSIVFALAALGDNVARYAWSARLYPQGGLRFFWTVVLLFVAFLSYVWRGDARRVAALRYAGHAVWLLAVLWSFENAVWATVVWAAYLALAAVCSSPTAPGVAPVAARFARSAWPAAALFLTGFLAIELVYRFRLGHLPDWRAYAEFTGLFTSGAIRPIFHVQSFGAAWSILIVLGAVGASAIAAVRARRWEVVPLLGATWFAVWATASYYAVEPLDLYVALLMAVLVPAAAIVVFVSREALRGDTTAFYARLGIAPLAIISIAFAFGEPSRLLQIKMPGVPGWTWDSTRSFPPLSGELARLLASARVAPGERVVFPTGPYWSELDQGLIFPFALRADGTTVEYESWLPTSPSAPQALYESLSPERRAVYVERFLALSQSGGWLVAYREPSACERVSPRLKSVRAYASTNFSLALCALSAARR